MIVSEPKKKIICQQTNLIHLYNNTVASCFDLQSFVIKGSLLQYYTIYRKVYIFFSCNLIIKY